MQEEKPNLPSEKAYRDYVQRWTPTATDEQERRSIKEWVFSKDVEVSDPTMAELRSQVAKMKGAQLERQLDLMAKWSCRRRPSAGVQLEVLLGKVRQAYRRSKNRKGPKSSMDKLEPDEAIQQLIMFIYEVRTLGTEWIEKRHITKKFCSISRGNVQSKEAPKALITNRNKMYNWLDALVTIGYLEEKRFDVQLRRPSEDAATTGKTFYRTTEAVMFSPGPLMNFSMKGQRLEDQIAHMPEYVTQFAEAYKIDVPELAIMACRRLHIAKDLLLTKAEILDPNAELDRIYKFYYELDSPNPPGIV